LTKFNGIFYAIGSKLAMKKKTQEEEDECDSLLQKNLKKMDLDLSLVSSLIFFSFLTLF
jgi:hypothetical protein